MSPARKIVVVGGGPAGVAAALAAKEQDGAAEVILLSDERHEPYEKPPLSKAVLTGKAMPQDAPIAGPKGVSAHGVRLEIGTAVKAIDRGAHTVITDAGKRIGYDALVLAIGSMNRVLAMFPPGRNGIYYLRTEAEARALKARLHQSRSLLVIGWFRVGPGEEQVLHLGRPSGQRRGRLVQGLVGPGQPAGVLAQVFPPGVVLRDLEELGRVRPVLVQLATARAGA